MYEEGCRQLRHRFALFVVSTDGVLSEPAKEIVQVLATKTAEKWEMEGLGHKSAVMTQLRAIIRGASWFIWGDREGRNRYAQNRVGGVDGVDKVVLRFLYMLSHQAYDSVAK